MHCIFITRCYKATNIQTIKDNLKEVFKGSKYTYEHRLIVDATRLNNWLEEFGKYHLDCFLPSTIYHEKRPKDEYNTFGIDEFISGAWDSWFIQKKMEKGGVYVYILDDDNQITPDFLAALDACEDGDPDAVVFKVYRHPQWGDISILDHDAIGKIDWANMLIRLDVMKRLKVYTLGADSQKSDGLFFEKMKREGCAIKFLNQICGRYNALPKP